MNIETRGGIPASAEKRWASEPDRYQRVAEKIRAAFNELPRQRTDAEKQVMERSRNFWAERGEQLTYDEIEIRRFENAAIRQQEAEDRDAKAQEQRRIQEIRAEEIRLDQEEKARLEAIQDKKDRIYREDGILGPRYRDANFDSWIFSDDPTACGYQKQVLQAVQDYASRIVENVDEGRNLILYGPVGTGKDFLMASVAKAISRMVTPKRPSIRASTPERMELCVGANLFASLRDAMGDGKESESKILKRYVTPSVLLLSDPLLPGGAELTPYQRGQLFHIVNERTVGMRPTITTINVADVDDMHRKLSPQVADRLLDGATVVHCYWPSFRKPQKVLCAPRRN